MKKSKLLSRSMPGMFLLFFVLMFWAVNSSAQGVTSSSPNIPPSNGQYVSPTAYHATYGTAGFVDNGTHGYFTASHPPPDTVGGSVQHNFGSMVNAVYHPNGSPPVTISAPAQVTTQVTKTSGNNPNAGTYQTEMLQLDIQGGTLPPGVKIRESPTLQSTGQTTITDLGGGQYHIDSFFDIFTELSLDNGTTWTPSTSGPTHMQLTPAGGIPTLTQWALIAFGAVLLIVATTVIVRRRMA